MVSVIRLNEDDHKEFLQAWIGVKLAEAGQYYKQGDAARAFRKISTLTAELCDKYDVPEDEIYELDVDRGLILVGM